MLCFSPLFVTWKKLVNGSEPRLRGCIGTLEARGLINGFKDYALNRYYHYSCTLHRFMHAVSCTYNNVFSCSLYLTLLFLN